MRARARSHCPLSPPPGEGPAGGKPTRVVYNIIIYIIYMRVCVCVRTPLPSRTRATAVIIIIIIYYNKQSWTILYTLQSHTHSQHIQTHNIVCTGWFTVPFFFRKQCSGSKSDFFLAFLNVPGSFPKICIMRFQKQCPVEI